MDYQTTNKWYKRFYYNRLDELENTILENFGYRENAWGYLTRDPVEFIGFANDKITVEVFYHLNEYCVTIIDTFDGIVCNTIANAFESIYDAVEFVKKTIMSLM
jgi:hypothetical protein